VEVSGVHFSAADAESTEANEQDEVEAVFSDVVDEDIDEHETNHDYDDNHEDDEDEVAHVNARADLADEDSDEQDVQDTDDDDSVDVEEENDEEDEDSDDDDGDEDEDVGDDDEDEDEAVKDDGDHDDADVDAEHDEDDTLALLMSDEDYFDESDEDDRGDDDDSEEEEHERDIEGSLVETGSGTSDYLSDDAEADGTVFDEVYDEDEGDDNTFGDVNEDVDKDGEVGDNFPVSQLMMAQDMSSQTPMVAMFPMEQFAQGEPLANSPFADKHLSSKLFHKLDTNSDGKIEYEELNAALTSLSQAASVTSPPLESNTEVANEAVGEAGGENIDKREPPKELTTNLKAVHKDDPMAMKIMNNMDKNGDGSADQQEMFGFLMPPTEKSSFPGTVLPFGVQKPSSLKQRDHKTKMKQRKKAKAKVVALAKAKARADAKAKARAPAKAKVGVKMQGKVLAKGNTKSGKNGKAKTVAKTPPCWRGSSPAEIAALKKKADLLKKKKEDMALKAQNSLMRERMLARAERRIKAAELASQERLRTLERIALEKEKWAQVMVLKNLVSEATKTTPCPSTPCPSTTKSCTTACPCAATGTGEATTAGTTVAP
jgi:hypothetical protein